METVNVGFRNKGIEFINLLKDNKIHFAIVSGGCSDIIGIMLSTVINLGEYKELEIYSNEMIYKGGFFQGFDLKLNSVGKKLAINNEIIEDRRNILLFGDILEDTTMVTNVEYDNLISFGFLNSTKNLKNDLKKFFTKYDVVVTNDGNFEIPN